MKQLINRDKCFKDNIRDIQPNKKITKNVITSRIPIRVPLNAKVAETDTSPKNSCIHHKKSLTSVPEKPYGRDRTRLTSSFGKRFGKTALESPISFKCRKENREKSKLIKQQLSYEKECEEMRVLLDKMQINASGDSTNDQSGCQLNGVRFNINDRKIEELSLGENAIQLYYHQTLKNLNENENVKFFANILNLKTKLIEATTEGNKKITEYEHKIGQLNGTIEELTAKIKLAEQQLVTQAAENTSIQESRTESFKKIEEKLRGIIEKLQCQFRSQKLLQAKTERELAVLRSDYFALEIENNKLSEALTNCSDERQDCQKLNESLKEKVSFHCQENEKIVRTYEEQLVALHTTIDRMENELVDARNRNNEYSAAHTKAENNFKQEKEVLQRTVTDTKQKLLDMEMLLSQKSNRVTELMKSHEEVVSAKNVEIKALKNEVQSKTATINNQCEKMLKLQRLLAVREVLLHTLKKDKNL
ncbi:uveal autoantigen with coiled-coil domains and ankyrin repeats protein-like [Bradysia coprophila]|uniref:uveal autoantigen with coiled-coil domains and ankyrin repeats protein-like n=1 Tax=Bradysia coprophila TaxID=38358 RepID=UPI00187D9D56|nr:uveal autoantigen with coiled-coil domains and ankyrin repeats protein-like [Bradysia coprophila]